MSENKNEVNASSHGWLWFIAVMIIFFTGEPDIHGLIIKALLKHIGT